MPLINCSDCNNEMSDSAPACPKCGKPNVTKASKVEEKRKISVLLGVGILFIPLIFSWFTLRKGYSSVTKAVSFVWLAISLAVISGQDGNESTNTTSTKAPAVAAEAAACKKDLQCWAEKFTILATVNCKQSIERLAKYDYEWTDGMLDVKFSHYRWKNINKGVVTYIGDKIKLQNVFGAWQNYVYECDFDPTQEVVLDVRGKLGHI